MAITLEIALKLPEMENIAVVAGSAGLWREVSAVNVMEVPDISKYLKRGELLITTMYSIRDREELQRELVPLLSEKGVAALALAPLHKNSEIPEFMLKQADELNFPILKIPYGTPFNDIMNAVLHSIVKQHYSTELIEDIIHGRVASLSQALTVGRLYNWNLKGAFIPAAVYGAIPVRLPSGVIAVELKSDTLLIFPLSDFRSEKKRTGEIIGLMEKQPTVCIGIGRAIENIIELPKGLAQARQALKVAKQVKGDNIACYDSLGVYRVLLADDDVHEKKFFVEELLGNILHEAELLATIKEYFRNNGNHRNTAKALHIHHNTVSNRLMRIEQLTGLILDNADDYLCLQVALKILELDLL